MKEANCISVSLAVFPRAVMDAALSGVMTLAHAIAMFVMSADPMTPEPLLTVQVWVGWLGCEAMAIEYFRSPPALRS